jgi:ribosome-interacting GTPase 1
MMSACRAADLILIVVDLSALDLLDQLARPVEMLSERGMALQSTPELVFGSLEDEHEHATPALPKRALVIANKCDTPGAADNFDGLRELSGSPLKMVKVSAATGEGLAGMMAEVFALLNVVRVYAKKPGKPVDKKDPFILPAGGTVADMAAHIHSDLAEKLKTARVWGSHVHDGQQVHATHVLGDKDVVELHF